MSDGTTSYTTHVAAALDDALAAQEGERGGAPWVRFPGRVPVCRDCGADWKPVRRGECSRCGSDAGPLTSERGGADGCECVGYTIRTDYGTGIEHDVDRSDCPVHGERGGAEVAAAVRGFVQWVSTHRAYNGSDHRHGQALYNECINGELPVWAEEWLTTRTGSQS